MKKDETGLHFLAKLGKTRLRPGGRLATEWLLANGDFRQDKKVLEVACHNGSTAIQIAKRFGCEVVGIDINPQIVDIAQKNINENKLSHLVSVQQADAMVLPFADNSFDIVINEAMLTMLSKEQQQRAIQEYYRVLKPNGFLLTHDLMLVSGENAGQICEVLSEILHTNVTPLTKPEWKNAFQQCGFRNVEQFSGKMTLLSPRGLIDDEGVLGTVNILRNALKTENREQFKALFRYFRQNTEQLGFVAACSQK